MDDSTQGGLCAVSAVAQVAEAGSKLRHLSRRLADLVDGSVWLEDYCLSISSASNGLR